MTSMLQRAAGYYNLWTAARLICRTYVIRVLRLKEIIYELHFYCTEFPGELPAFL